VRRAPAAVAFLLALLAAPARAQEPAAAPSVEIEPAVATVTLAEALSRSASVDPNYVGALRQIGDADWVRRSAWSAFLLPVVDFQWSWTKGSSPFFNIGTGGLTDELTSSRCAGAIRCSRGARASST